MHKVTYGWLSGFCDRASQVHKASRSIVITSIDETLMRSIVTFLVKNKFNVMFSEMPGSNPIRYIVRVSGKDSLEKWRSEVGFATKSKMAQLDDVLALYKDGTSE